MYIGKDFKRWEANLSDEDQAKVLKAFTKSGCKSKAEFVRKMLLNEPITVITRDQEVAKFTGLLKQLHDQVKKIGVNINQIAKIVNSEHRKVTDKDIMNAILEYQNSVNILISSALQITKRVDKITRKKI